jgi:hypothetical protein
MIVKRQPSIVPCKLPFRVITVFAVDDVENRALPVVEQRRLIERGDQFGVADDRLFEI